MIFALLLLQTSTVFGASIPSSSISGSGTHLLGSAFEVNFVFDNTGDAIGYGPFLDIVIPSKIIDNVTTALPIEIGAISYLSETITPTIVNFVGTTNESICITHPYSASVGGSNSLFSSKVCALRGAQLRVYRLPFVSFSHTLIAAVLKSYSFTLTEHVWADLPLYYRAGFVFGDSVDPTSPTAFPQYSFAGVDDGFGTLVSSAYDWSYTVFNGLPFTMTFYYYPSWHFTGPTVIRWFRLEFDLSDVFEFDEFWVDLMIPGDMVITSWSTESGMAASMEKAAASGVSGNNTMQLRYGGRYGSGGTLGRGGQTRLSTRIYFYIARWSWQGFATLSWARNRLSNSTTVRAGYGTRYRSQVNGSWITSGYAWASRSMGYSAYSGWSWMSVYRDVQGNGLSPGDTVEGRASVSVSLYFSFRSIVMTLTIRDGLDYNAAAATGFIPTLTCTGHTAWNLTSPLLVVSAGPGLGETTLVVDITASLVAHGLPAITNSTYCIFAFRAVVRNSYVADGSNVNQGNWLGFHHRTPALHVLWGGVGWTDMGTRTVSRSAGGHIAHGSLQFVAYSKNNVICYPCANGMLLRPLDLVTFSVRYSLVTSDYQGVAFTVWPTHPVFPVTLMSTTATFTSANSTAPALGDFSLGPSDTFLARSTLLPSSSISVDISPNQLGFIEPAWSDIDSDRSQMEVLFTMRASDNPFPDRMIATSLAKSVETGGPTQIDTYKVVVQQPVLSITSGFIATDSAFAGLPTVHPSLTIAPPRSPWSRITPLPLSSNVVSAMSLGAHVTAVDGADWLTAVVVIQNIGSASCFDIAIRVVIGDIFLFPASSSAGINVTSGAGFQLPFQVHPLDVGVGFTLNLTRAGAPGGVVLDAAHPTSGLDLAFVTFDIQLLPCLRPSPISTDSTPASGNVSVEITHYAGAPGGMDHVTSPVFAAEPQYPIVELASCVLTSAMVWSSDALTVSSRLRSGAPDLLHGESFVLRVNVTLMEMCLPNAGITIHIAGAINITQVTLISVGTSLVGGPSLVDGAVQSVSYTVQSTGLLLHMSLGTITNTPDNLRNTGDQLAFDLFGRAVDNIALGTSATVVAELTYTEDGVDELPVIVGQIVQDLDIVVPRLQLTLTRTPSTALQAFDVVAYTATLSHHSASEAPAYRVRLDIDTLLTSITSKLLMSNATLHATPPPSPRLYIWQDPVLGTGRHQIVAHNTNTTDPFPLGETLDISFSAVVQQPAQADNTLTLRGDVSYRSSPYTESIRYRPLSTSGSASVRMMSPRLDSAMIGSSLPITMTSADRSSVDDLSIGECATLFSGASLIRGTIQGQVIMLLPQELELIHSNFSFAGHRVRTSSMDVALHSPALPVSPSFTPSGGTAYSWFFGTFPVDGSGMGDSESQRMWFYYTVRVRDIAASVAGDRLRVEARFYYRSLAFSGLVDRNDIMEFDVVEPNMLVSAFSASPLAVDANDTVALGVTLSHTGSSSAPGYQVQCFDPLLASGAYTLLSTSIDGVVSFDSESSGPLGDPPLKLGSHGQFAEISVAPLGAAPYSITYIVKLGAGAESNSSIALATISCDYHSSPPIQSCGNDRGRTYTTSTFTSALSLTVRPPELLPIEVSAAVASLGFSVGRNFTLTVGVVIPEGTTSALTVRVNVDPANVVTVLSAHVVAPVQLSSSRGPFHSFTGSPVVQLHGTYAVFDLGTIVNLDSDNSRPEVLHLHVTCIAADLPSAVPGYVIHPHATLSAQLITPQLTVAAPPLRLQQPDLETGALSVSSRWAQAGDTIIIALSLRHTSRSNFTAYRVTLSNSLLLPWGPLLLTGVLVNGALVYQQGVGGDLGLPPPRLSVDGTFLVLPEVRYTAPFGGSVRVEVAAVVLDSAEVGRTYPVNINGTLYTHSGGGGFQARELPLHGGNNTLFSVTPPILQLNVEPAILEVQPLSPGSNFTVVVTVPLPIGQLSAGDLTLQLNGSSASMHLVQFLGVVAGTIVPVTSDCPPASLSTFTVSHTLASLSVCALTNAAFANRVQFRFSAVVPSSTAMSGDSVTFTATMQTASLLINATRTLHVQEPSLYIESSLRASASDSRAAVDAGDTVTFNISLCHNRTLSANSAFRIQVWDSHLAANPSLGTLPYSLSEVRVNGQAQYRVQPAMGVPPPALLQEGLFLDWPMLPLASRCLAVSYDVVMPTSIPLGGAVPSFLRIKYRSHDGSSSQPPRVYPELLSRTVFVFAATPSQWSAMPDSRALSRGISVGQELVILSTLQLPEGTLSSCVWQLSFNATNLVNITSASITASPPVSLSSHQENSTPWPLFLDSTNASVLTSALIRLPFATLVNWDRSPASNESLTLEARAVLLDVHAARSGTSLTANSSISCDLGPALSTTTPVVRLVEPRVSVSGISSSASICAAGDVLTFSLALIHQPLSTADAYSLQLRDVALANGGAYALRSVRLDGTTVYSAPDAAGANGVGSTPAQLAVTGDFLLLPLLRLSARSVLVEYDVQVRDTAEAGALMATRVSGHYLTRSSAPFGSPRVLPLASPNATVTHVMLPSLRLTRVDSSGHVWSGPVPALVYSDDWLYLKAILELPAGVSSNSKVYLNIRPPAALSMPSGSIAAGKFAVGRGATDVAAVGALTVSATVDLGDLVNLQCSTPHAARAEIPFAVRVPRAAAFGLNNRSLTVSLQADTTLTHLLTTQQWAVGMAQLSFSTASLAAATVAGHSVLGVNVTISHSPFSSASAWALRCTQRLQSSPVYPYSLRSVHLGGELLLGPYPYNVSALTTGASMKPVSLVSKSHLARGTSLSLSYEVWLPSIDAAALAVSSSSPPFFVDCTYTSQAGASTPLLTSSGPLPTLTPSPSPIPAPIPAGTLSPSPSALVGSLFPLIVSTTCGGPSFSPDALDAVVCNVSLAIPPQPGQSGVSLEHDVALWVSWPPSVVLDPLRSLQCGVIADPSRARGNLSLVLNSAAPSATVQFLANLPRLLPASSPLPLDIYVAVDTRASVAHTPSNSVMLSRSHSLWSAAPRVLVEGTTDCATDQNRSSAVAFFNITVLFPEGVTPNAELLLSFPSQQWLSVSAEFVGRNLAFSGPSRNISGSHPVVSAALSRSHSLIRLAPSAAGHTLYLGNVTNQPDQSTNERDRLTLVARTSSTVSESLLSGFATLRYTNNRSISAHVSVTRQLPSLVATRTNSASVSASGDLQFNSTIFVGYTSTNAVAHFPAIRYSLAPNLHWLSRSLHSPQASISSVLEDSATLIITPSVTAVPTSGLTIQLQATARAVSISPFATLLDNATLTYRDSASRHGAPWCDHNISIPTAPSTSLSARQWPAAASPSVVVLSDINRPLEQQPALQVQVGFTVHFIITQPFLGGVFLPNATLVVPLPAGFTTLGASITQQGHRLRSRTPSGRAVPLNPRVEVLPSLVRLQLGEVTNLADGIADGGDSLRLRVDAVVTDLPDSQEAILPVVGSISWNTAAGQVAVSAKRGGSAGSRVSNSAPIILQEPLVSVVLSSPLSNAVEALIAPKSSVRYEVKVQHNNQSTGTSYDMEVGIAIPPSLSVSASSVHVVKGNATVDTGDSTMLVLTTPKMEVGEVLTVEFDATVVTCASDVVTVTAALVYDSSPLDIDGRTGKPGPSLPSGVPLRCDTRLPWDIILGLVLISLLCCCCCFLMCCARRCRGEKEQEETGLDLFQHKMEKVAPATPHLVTDGLVVDTAAGNVKGTLTQMEEDEEVEIFDLVPAEVDPDDSSDGETELVVDEATGLARRKRVVGLLHRVTRLCALPPPHLVTTSSPNAAAGPTGASQPASLGGAEGASKSVVGPAASSASSGPQLAGATVSAATGAGAGAGAAPRFDYMLDTASVTLAGEDAQQWLDAVIGHAEMLCALQKEKEQTSGQESKAGMSGGEEADDFGDFGWDHPAVPALIVRRMERTKTGRARPVYDSGDEDDYDDDGDGGDFDPDVALQNLQSAPHTPATKVGSLATRLSRLHEHQYLEVLQDPAHRLAVTATLEAAKVAAAASTAAPCASNGTSVACNAVTPTSAQSSVTAVGVGGSSAGVAAAAAAGSTAAVVGPAASAAGSAAVSNTGVAITAAAVATTGAANTGVATAAPAAAAAAAAAAAPAAAAGTDTIALSGLSQGLNGSGALVAPTRPLDVEKVHSANDLTPVFRVYKLRRITRPNRRDSASPAETKTTAAAAAAGGSSGEEEKEGGVHAGFEYIVQAMRAQVSQAAAQMTLVNMRATELARRRRRKKYLVKRRNSRRNSRRKQWRRRWFRRCSATRRSTDPNDNGEQLERKLISTDCSRLRQGESFELLDEPEPLDPKDAGDYPDADLFVDAGGFPHRRRWRRRVRHRLRRVPSRVVRTRNAKSGEEEMVRQRQFLVDDSQPPVGPAAAQQSMDLFLNGSESDNLPDSDSDSPATGSAAVAAAGRSGRLRKRRGHRKNHNHPDGTWKVVARKRWVRRNSSRHKDGEAKEKCDGESKASSSSSSAASGAISSSASKAAARSQTPMDSKEAYWVGGWDPVAAAAAAEAEAIEKRQAEARAKAQAAAAAGGANAAFYGLASGGELGLNTEELEDEDEWETEYIYIGCADAAQWETNLYLDAQTVAILDETVFELQETKSANSAASANGATASEASSDALVSGGLLVDMMEEEETSTGVTEARPIHGYHLHTHTRYRRIVRRRRFVTLSQVLPFQEEEWVEEDEAAPSAPTMAGFFKKAGREIASVGMLRTAAKPPTAASPPPRKFWSTARGMKNATWAQVPPAQPERKFWHASRGIKNAKWQQVTPKEEPARKFWHASRGVKNAKWQQVTPKEEPARKFWHASRGVKNAKWQQVTPKQEPARKFWHASRGVKNAKWQQVTPKQEPARKFWHASRSIKNAKWQQVEKAPARKLWHTSRGMQKAGLVKVEKQTRGGLWGMPKGLAGLNVFTPARTEEEEPMLLANAEGQAHGVVHHTRWLQHLNKDGEVEVVQEEVAPIEQVQHGAREVEEARVREEIRMRQQMKRRVVVTTTVTTTEQETASVPEVEDVVVEEVSVRRVKRMRRRKNDPVDQLLANTMNKWACGEEFVPFIRAEPGRYWYQDKLVIIKIVCKNIVVRVGGGYVALLEFLTNEAADPALVESAKRSLAAARAAKRKGKGGASYGQVGVRANVKKKKGRAVERGVKVTRTEMVNGKVVGSTERVMKKRLVNSTDLDEAMAANDRTVSNFKNSTTDMGRAAASRSIETKAMKGGNKNKRKTAVAARAARKQQKKRATRTPPRSRK